METAQYCREVERHLCRKNDGHLIRIVGPSFERVRGWAERGIPLAIALHGIDRHFERYYARGTRRRPVHIDFCEADVLDVFDEWRRAVGVRGIQAAGAGSAAPDDERPGRRRPGLKEHLDRLVLRLTAARTSSMGPALDRALERAVRELDAVREPSRRARGDARARILALLVDLDRELASALTDSMSGADRAALVRDAEAELAPFRMRMPEDAYARAIDVSIERRLRERAGLPRLSFD
jgi:hypothetical protein